MKKLTICLFAIFAIAACTEGGSGDDGGDGGNGGSNNGGGSSQPTITIDASSAPNFETEGGSQAITFTASEAWTAEVINSRADGWCSISPTSGAAGSATITVTTEPNDTPDDRSASIVIKAGSASKTISVSQKQKDALTVTASKFEVEAEGGEVKIEVKANIDFEYAIDESAQEWIKYEGTRAIKTSTLTFSVAENDDTKKREAKIYITSGEFNEEITIYQDGTEPSIVISQNEYIVSADGETIAVEVASNVDVDVELPANVDWISENTTRGISTNTYYFDIAPSEEYDQRSAEIKFTNKENNLSEVVKVTQVQKDALVVAKESYTIDSEGGQLQIEVGHNVDFDIEISNDWITKAENTRAFVTETLNFNIAKNPTTDNREGTIVFKSKDGKLSQTVKVYQAQEDALIISKKDIVVSDEGGTISFELQTNVEFKVSEPDVDWLRPVVTRGLTTHTLNYTVDANTSYDSREAKIVVTDTKNNKSETITITQAQKDAIVLAKSEYEFGTDGGNLDFEIQTNVDVTVTISDDAKDWIQQVETRALETKTLYFNVSACSAEEDREGTITISGGNATQTITVKQSGLKEIFEQERLEREALIAFYNATGGDNWTRNDNWCSDKPVGEWYGIGMQQYIYGVAVTSRVRHISLEENNLTGSINGELDILTDLEWIDVRSNNLTGIQMSKNEKLRHISCYGNQLKTIDITGLVGLEELSCFDNELKTIDVSTNVNLLDLKCGNNQIQSLNLGNISKLWQLSCANNPIKEINTDNLINLTSLSCSECLLTTLSVKASPKLESLSCYGNSITNLDVSNNSKLVQIICANNPIENIDLSNCPLLETLWLNECQLSNLDVSKLANLQVLLCSGNNLESIDVSNNPELNTLWCSTNNLSELNISNNPKLYSLVCGNELDLYTGDVVSGNNNISEINVSSNPELEVLDISGNKLTQLDVTHNTKLRQLELHSNNIHHIDLSRNIQLEELYYAYNGVSQLDLSNTPLLKRLECSNNNIETVDLSNNTNLVNLYCSSNNFKELDISYSPDINILSCGKNPYLTKIYVNSSQKFEYWKDDIAEFIYKDGGGGGEPDKPSYYESTDYSQDGIVTKLQSATKGKGIDIVLMGDGYSDRLIIDGTYDRVMNTAMEKFFIEEPYKSFRDYFNVYSVKAVSKNEVFAIDSETAFAGYFGAEGTTHVGGNDQRVFSYAVKAVGAERMDDALMVVMMNSEAYAGTCYMYYPTDNDNWGDGVSISYFPVGVDDNALAQVLQHEAGGHGFSKLADEYESFFIETITTDAIASIQAVEAYGWHKNIDLTSDPTQVKWSHFLIDSRYANEGLGVYEGAFVFTKGVYRPSWNSIMRDNTGGFNAPSREAIYYRIHKLAYGSEWEYDYEKFVEYDAINRTTATATRGVPYRLDIPEDFKPLHPPVIINTSWRNAKDNTPAKNATRSMGGNVGHNLQKSAGATSHATTKPMSITSSVTIDLLNSTKLTITTTSSGAKSEIVTTR